MSDKISARKIKSYKRAEDVAREMRHQLSAARTSFDINYDIIFELLVKWMRVTGNIKYKRPRSAIVMHKKLTASPSSAE